MQSSKPAGYQPLLSVAVVLQGNHALPGEPTLRCIGVYIVCVSRVLERECYRSGVITQWH